MGVVRRQGIKGFVLSYIGVTLGFVNKTVLFANILRADYFGFIEFLQAIMVIGSGVALLGIPSVVLRFFPYVRTNEARQRSFTFVMLVIPLFFFAFLCGLFLLFQDPLLDWYSSKSPLVHEKYYFVLPIVFAFLLSDWLFVFSTAHIKSVVPVFFREIVLRVQQTIIAVLLYYEIIGNEMFLVLFVAGYFFISLLNLVYLVWLGRLKFSFDFSFLQSRLFRLMAVFGLIAFITNWVYLLVLRIDITFLGKMEGMELVGVYSIAAYLGSLIYIPGRTLYNITTPLIARSWKERDMDNIRKIYQKSALNNLLIGSLLFILIWVNLDVLFSFMKPQFALAKYPALVICLSRLFDISTGVGAGILVTSKNYSSLLVFTLLALAVTIAGNLLLIPHWGMMGAALGTGAGILVYNSLVLIYVKVKFNFDPFTFHMAPAFIIALAALGIGLLIPDFSNRWASLFIKSAAVVIIFGAAVLFFQVSEDVRQLGLIAKRRIANFLGKN